MLMRDAIAKDGKVVMHDLERRNLEVANGEGLVRMNFMKLDGGHARIAMLRKAIRQHFQHAFPGNGIGIDVDFTKLTIGTDIVHTAHVVVVGVGNQDAVDTPERLWHDLLSEIGATVDEQA